MSTESVSTNVCEHCSKGFTEKKNLLRHLSNVHGREKNGFKCALLCGNKITTQEVYIHHLKKRHDLSVETEECTFKNMKGKLIDMWRVKRWVTLSCRYRIPHLEKESGKGN